MKRVVGKIWGYEEIIVNNKLYCGKILTILQNKKCSIHYHKKKTETFYITQGSIILEVYDNIKLDNCQTYILLVGDSITLEPNTPHRFYGVEPINKFIEFSTHDDVDDTYRLQIKNENND